jgi:histone-lysine N-methyltransferase SETMAR
MPKHEMENISITETKKKKARMSRAQVKTMLICVFDHKGIVHFEFLELGQTVNQHCYLEILARLREVVRRRRPELWPDAWILHHDIAPAHNTLTVQEFLAKKSIMKLDHPLYLPDLAPCSFWLFPKLKTTLKVAILNIY